MAKGIKGVLRMLALSTVSHFAVAAAAIAATLLLIDQKPWRETATAGADEVAICDLDRRFIGLMPRDTFRAIFGEQGGDYPVRSAYSGEDAGLLAISFGKPVPDSFDLEGFNSRQDGAILPFASVHLDEVPSDFGTALRKAVDDVSGDRIYQPAVYFYASSDEEPLSWPRVDAVFGPFLDLIRSEAASWERYASAPSCYLARQKQSAGISSVYAMSTSAGSEREQAQCYWTALQTAYGLSGVSFLYHRKALQDEGARYAASFFPQDILYRRLPPDWGIGAGSYLLSNFVHACHDILALTDS